MRLINNLLMKNSVNSAANYYYVTTPIYYVNAAPHIGHLYSSLIADCAVRWHKLCNPQCKIKFATGTDEHGIKVQQAAFKSGDSLQEYCGKVSLKYRELSQKFSVNYTDFIRTSEKSHAEAVQHFWRTIKRNGFVYSAKYSGWYCVPDESFLVESQLKEVTNDKGERVKVSAESGHLVEWTEEENYMFKLGQLSHDVRHWILKEDSVRPKKFQKILLDMLEEGLPDVSISRPASRVHWGIKVPDDETQTVYVWLDALINYLTATGYPKETNFWPANLHVIGKDILKFHGIYWPAFLMAADLEPPRSILCHSHWTVDGEKMSKSRMNVVCPMERARIYTEDGFRYFLLREGVPHSDGNYSETKVLRYLNAELADTLGNLLSRCCGKSLNPDQVFPPCEPEAFDLVAKLDVAKQLMESVQQLPEIAADHYEQCHFYKAIDATIATLHIGNLFFETTKPWLLKKSAGTLKQLDVVLHLTLETLRVCSVILSPVVPNLSKNILSKINVPPERATWRSLETLSWNAANFHPTHFACENTVLFPRIQQDRQQQLLPDGGEHVSQATKKKQPKKQKKLLL